MVTYTQWKPSDVINICVSIDEFCGINHQYIYPKDINVTKYPDSCSLIFGTERGCGLHLNNVEFTFKLVKTISSTEQKTCNPQQVYNTIGTARTDSNGVANFIYEVTDQDRLDYESSGGNYKVMACITNGDGNLLDSGYISITTSSITIVQNICYGIMCTKPICSNGKLYEPICDSATGLCVVDTNRLILDPCPTHYIEYDFSILPSSFLNYVSTYITDIVNNIGIYLNPILPINVIYRTVTYDSQNRKFRLFVDYTGTLGLSNNIETLVDIPQALGDLAWTFAGIAMFIIGAIIVVAVPGYGLIIGPVVAVAGIFVVQWSITNLQTNIEGTGTRGDVIDSDKIRIVREYAALLVQKCGELHPGCCGSPCVPTCSAIDMSSYNKCLGANQIAEYTWDHGINDNFVQSEYDSKKNQILDDSLCLQNGTCTIKRVADNIGNREKDRIIDSEKQGDIAKEREILQNCWIKGPLGSCILSAKTGKTILVIGGLAAASIIIYNNVVKK